MDKLKSPYLFNFISPTKISVKKFIESWNKNLVEDLSLLNHKNAIELDASDFDIPVSMCKSLHKELNPTNLCNSFKDDKFLNENMTKLDDELHLETLKEINQNNEGNTFNSRYRMQYYQKYRHELIDKPVEVTDMVDYVGRQNNCPLARLTIQIFKPSLKQTGRSKVYLDHEFQVLSSQALTTLRDSYVCISDILSDRDYSNNPMEAPPRFTRHEKAGFFFIDDILYNDTRFDNVSLNSIVQWAEKKLDNPFKECRMQDTKFEDLSIQLGYPYLYVHAGNCEHLVVFTDVQMFIPALDISSNHKYPKCTARENMQRVKCQMCLIQFSKWVTIDNKRLPSSKFYFCHNCFLSFNYDSNLEKIGSFKAYPILLNLDI